MKKKISSVMSTVCNFALVFMLISMAATLFKGNPAEENFIAIVYEGEFYVDESKPLSMTDTTALEFEVRQYGEANEVTAKVYATANTEKDVLFRYAGQTHSWNEEIAGCDLTEVLGIVVTQATEESSAKITLENNLFDVLKEASRGQEVTLVEDLTCSLMTIEVRAGEEILTVNLLQTVYKATGFELSDSNIIF